MTSGQRRWCCSVIFLTVVEHVSGFSIADFEQFENVYWVVFANAQYALSTNICYLKEREKKEPTQRV